jgi:hypothetical protein
MGKRNERQVSLGTDGETLSRLELQMLLTLLIMEERYGLQILSVLNRLLEHYEKAVEGSVVEV